MSWEQKVLGDISTSIQTGPFGSQLHQSDYSDEGVPVVMPKDLIQGVVSEESIARVSKEHVERLSKHKIKDGDILYSRRGDVGKCAFTSERERGWICGTGCLKVSVDKDKADPRFIFYQLQKAETIGWVINHAVGSTMLNLNTSILSAVPVDVPEIEIQRKIVKILSSYDELIVNNQKQIKLLEEMEDAEGKRSMGNFQISAKQKQLLVDYAQIKQFTAGNMAISIQNEDYPRFKDTLEYMVEYEFIIPADVDFGFGIDHMYFKQPAFETFTEHVLTQEMEEEPKVVQAYSGKKVFIVHGHDHQLLDEVELMLRRIGLEPIIVKNEANAGRTIIEKIEDLTDVGFDIVLYTCCDEGRKKGDSDLKDRARQNVIFEHGYLYAKLGRGRVAALNDDGIEISSDLSGVLYISHVTSDWKNQLMREMKEAGLDFDSTKA